MTSEVQMWAQKREGYVFERILQNMHKQLQNMQNFLNEKNCAKYPKLCKIFEIVKKNMQHRTAHA